MPDIQNKLPEKKFQEYLKKFNISSTKELFPNTITQIFLLMIHDFKTGIISLDELSPMAEELLNRLSILEKDMTATRHALECVNDLYYDLRIVQDQFMAEIFIANLQEVLNYYDKNEYVIKSLLSKENLDVN